MIVARGAALALASALVFVAFGGRSGDLQPSASRLAATALVALLAPLFWPGTGATGTGRISRLGAWTAIATAVAASLLLLVDPRPQAAAQVAASCAMLLPIVLLSHAALAALEARWRRQGENDGPAHERAGRTVALWLALAGALPLWAGPLAESLDARREGAVDAVLAVSPLTHLALAGGNDLLRNQWWYERSNLALLHFSYPELSTVAWTCAAACALLAAHALVTRRRAGGPMDITQGSRPS